MHDSLRPFGSNRNDANIDLVFLLYWGVLVFWQNINKGSTGTLADTLLKMVLISVLTVYYLMHTHSFSLCQLAFSLLFAVNMTVSFMMEETASLRMILNYFFPVLFVFLSLVAGGELQLSRRKTVRFMRGVILLVSYMAVYAVVTEPETFLNALSVTNAYGNELSSFFISNHEYGMYLMAGVAACLICLELDTERPPLLSCCYLVAIPVFLVNLVLTYSRTSMLATLLFLAVYILCNLKSRYGRLMGAAAVLTVTVILTVPVLRVYCFEIVMKGNNPAGRDRLAAAAMSLFREGTLPQKLWGHGVTVTTAVLRTEAGHSSAHNAYLEVILYYGLIGFAVMLAFVATHMATLIRSFKENRVVGVIGFGLLLACISTILTNTAVLFTSPIDSFFLTVFTVLVPRYMRNAVEDKVFSLEKEGAKSNA